MHMARMPRALRMNRDMPGEPTSAVRVGFNQRELAVVVGQPAIGLAVSVLVERGGLQRAAAVRFPLVGAAVAVGVFLGTDETGLVVVLPAIDLVLVGRRRDLDALHLVALARVRPCVGIAVLLSREADLQQLPLLAVILPAIDGAVLVEIDAGPERPGAVHVGPRVDLPVLVPVVRELGELAGGLVVGRFRRLLDRSRSGSEQADDRVAVHTTARQISVRIY